MPRATRWLPSSIYIPMPESVVKDVEAMWAAEIVGADGKPVYAGM